MAQHTWNETFEERHVTYVLELDGAIIVIEGVPARINVETGERLFAPATVEKIQAILRSHTTPAKVIQTPVFDFAA